MRRRLHRRGNAEIPKKGAEAVKKHSFNESMASPPLLHRSKHSSPTVTERKPVLFCWQEGKSRMAGPGGYRRQKEGDGRLRPGKLTMILRFLRRSSLNGDSWSIAIRSSSCSPLRERLRPLLSKSPRRAEPSSCRPCSCTQRKTAGQGRRARRFQAATGGRKMWAGAGAGEAKQAEGKWAGEWAYMHADAGLSREVGIEVGIGIATGRCLLGGGCGRNKGGVAVLIPSPPLLPGR